MGDECHFPSKSTHAAVSARLAGVLDALSINLLVGGMRIPTKMFFVVAVVTSLFFCATIFERMAHLLAFLGGESAVLIVVELGSYSRGLLAQSFARFVVNLLAFGAV